MAPMEIEEVLEWSRRCMDEVRSAPAARRGCLVLISTLLGFIPTAFANDAELLIDVEYTPIAIAPRTQLILLGVTLASISRFTQSRRQTPDYSHVRNDLSSKIPIHLPKITTYG